MPALLPDHDPETMRAEYLAQACLSLICELETSLHRGQAALLALDAGETELCTREQLRLQRALAALLFDPSISRADALPLGPHAPELAQKSCDGAKRVLHLARVQAALLRRAQEFLCVLSNCVASREAVYTPPNQARCAQGGATTQTGVASCQD